MLTFSDIGEQKYFFLVHFQEEEKYGLGLYLTSFAAYRGGYFPVIISNFLPIRNKNCSLRDIRSIKPALKPFNPLELLPEAFKVRKLTFYTLCILNEDPCFWILC